MKQLTFGWLCVQHIKNLNLTMCSWSFAVFAAKSSALLLLIWCYHWWKSRVVAECLVLFIQEFDAVKCKWVCRDLVWFQWILWSTQREHCLHCTDVSPTELLWENAIWSISVNVTLNFREIALVTSYLCWECATLLKKSKHYLWFFKIIYFSGNSTTFLS